MANAFDIDKVLKNGVDQNVDTHLLNETFHVFSKSPASNGTTLGGARLKSGHTTTASDVWADEIPAFFSAANQAKFDLFSTLAVKDDLCIFGGKVYQHNGTQFVSLGTEAEVLVDGATFQKNNKDVIKYHKNRAAINLTADNNNGDGSNNLSAKIYDAATGSTNFVSQFISSTDKMVAGVPSLAYDATVIADGVKLAEGLTNDNDYICNAYAGVIQFNKARSSGVTVSAWEYIGDKLTTSISSIRQSIKDISDVTLKGVVASVTADENTAQKAGITVDNTVSTTPVIKFTGGSVTTGETRLVTGDAVKTYVDTTALAEGGSIAKAIADYVATNAKVSVNGQSATTITVAGTAAGAADLVKVVVTEDKSTENKIGLTLTATLDAAVIDKDGNIDKDGVVIATIAKDIAESVADTAITNAITSTDGAIKDAIDDAITGATLNSGTQGDNQIQSATGDTANKLVTAAQVKEYVTENAQVTVTVGETEVTSTGFEFEGSTGTDVSVGAVMDANGKVTYSATLSKATVAADGTITNGGLAVSATDAKTIAEAAVSTSLSATGTGTIGGAISGLDGRLTDAEEAIDSLTGTGADSVDGKVTAAKNELQGKIDAINTSLTSGDIHNEIDGVRQTANTAVQSASGDTYVSAEKETGTTNIKVSANISAIDSKLAETSSAVGGAIKAAAAAAAQSLTDAKKYTDDEIDKVEKSISDALTTHSQDIAKVEAAISSLSTSGFERVVVSELPTTDIKLNAIYLVPMTTAEKELNGYAEYIYVGGTVTEGVVSGGKFEQIGTTKTDLAEYAKTSEVTATIEALDAEETVNGLTVTQVDGKITGITEALITASVPKDTTAVEGNIAYVGSTKHVIAPEKFETAVQMPSTLTSWVADLSNLTNGDNMFKGCTGLTVFVGDLSSLTSGVDMFNGCTLDAESLEILAENLPVVSGGTIDIGASTNATEEVIATIKGKGWTVKSNGTDL